MARRRRVRGVVHTRVGVRYNVFAWSIRMEPGPRRPCKSNNRTMRTGSRRAGPARCAVDQQRTERRLSLARYPASACAKSPDQVVAVLDPARNTDQRIGDAHRRAARGAHLPEDRVRHRDGERAVVAQVRRQHDDAEAVQEVEAVDAVGELEREQSAGGAEQRASPVHAADASRAPGSRRRGPVGCRGEKLRERLRIRARALHPQRERLRADADVMRLLGRERTAPVAQALLAQLLEAPERGLQRLVVVGNVRDSASSRRGPCR